MGGPEILRLAAFTDRPDGGNPAGVVLDARGLDAAAMQRIAAAVGDSETAFVVAAPDDAAALRVRYFSPLAEVPFCGHATIATGVAWGRVHGPGTLRLSTPAGLVRVEVGDGDPPTATLTSVAPTVHAVTDDAVDEALASLGWTADELDPAIAPAVAAAGARHLVLAAATRERLARLTYDFDRLGAQMAREDWTTVQLVHREGPAVFHARNPFPPGGVVEDPATGAAAAALGGLLRERRLVEAPARLTVHQGADMGRPSRLEVEIDAEPGSGIRVSGTAVPIPAE